MSRRMKGDGQLGQDLKLRDLHVLSTVVRLGSMAKAAAHLGVSQPAISEIIANLESVLKVRLLDRSRQGIESTIYGRTLLKRSLAAFDELKQGLAEIESLADPTAGELRIGCPESAAAAVVAPVVQRFMGQYPRVSLQMRQLIMPAFELAELPERKLDIVVTRHRLFQSPTASGMRVSRNPFGRLISTLEPWPPGARPTPTCAPHLDPTMYPRCMFWIGARSRRPTSERFA